MRGAMGYGAWPNEQLRASWVKAVFYIYTFVFAFMVAVLFDSCSKPNKPNCQTAKCPEGMNPVQAGDVCICAVLPTKT